MLRAPDNALDFAAQGFAAAQQTEREADERGDEQHAQDIVVRAGPRAEFGKQGGRGAERHAPVGIGNIGKGGELAIAVTSAQQVYLAIDPLPVHALAQRETARRFAGRRQDRSEALRRQGDQHDGLVLGAARARRHLRERCEPLSLVLIDLGLGGLTAAGSTHEVYLDVVAQPASAAAQLHRAHGVQAQEAQAQGIGKKLFQRGFKRFYFQVPRRSLRDRRGAVLPTVPGPRRGEGGRGRQDKGLLGQARRRGSLCPVLQHGDGGADKRGLLCGVGAGRALDQGAALRGLADQQQIERSDDGGRQEGEQTRKRGAAQRIAAGADPPSIALFAGGLRPFRRGRRPGRGPLRVFLFDELDHWSAESPRARGARDRPS